MINLSQYISESFNGVQPVNEAFESRILSTLVANAGSNADKSYIVKMFNEFASKAKIAASKIEDADIITIQGKDVEKAFRLQKKLGNIIAIHVDSSDRPILITDGSKDMYSHLNANAEPQTAKMDKYNGIRFSSNVEKHIKFNEFDRGYKPSTKQLLSITYKVYVLDINVLQQKYNLQELLDERKAAKLNALALKNPKDFKREQLARYNKLLAEKTADTGVEDMVKYCVERLTDLAVNSAENDKRLLDKRGNVYAQFDENDEYVIRIEDIGSAIQRVLTNYSRVISADTMNDRWGGNEFKSTAELNDIRVIYNNLKMHNILKDSSWQRSVLKSEFVWQ